MPRRTLSTKRVAYGLAIYSGALLAAAGCSTPKKGRLVDSLGGNLTLTTPSAQAARAANVTRSSTPETHQPTIHASAKPGTVTHTPTYFRSDAERPDSDDRVFGLSGKDYAASAIESVKFLISIATHPIDVLITPPWTLMESDAETTRRAARGDRRKHGSG